MVKAQGPTGVAAALLAAVATLGPCKPPLTCHLSGCFYPRWVRAEKATGSHCFRATQQESPRGEHGFHCGFGHKPLALAPSLFPVTQGLQLSLLLLAVGTAWLDTGVQYAGSWVSDGPGRQMGLEHGQEALPNSSDGSTRFQMSLICETDPGGSRWDRGHQPRMLWILPGKA